MLLTKIHIWDSQIYAPTKEQFIENSFDVPEHEETSAYVQVSIALDKFVGKAFEQYPEMYYEGNYFEGNGIVIGYVPEEIYVPFTQLIEELASKYGMYVYEYLTDTLTAPQNNPNRPLGTAEATWQNQLQQEQQRQEAIENGDELPQNQKEMYQYYRKELKARKAQLTTPKVKFTDEGAGIVLENDDLKLDLYCKIDYNYMNHGRYAIKAWVEMRSHAYRYYQFLKAPEKYQQDGLLPSAEFLDIWFELYYLSEEVISNYDNSLYNMPNENDLKYNIHRAIDMFTNIYPHCASWDSLYHYFAQVLANPETSFKMVSHPRTKLYIPIESEVFLWLAKITNQPDYPTIKKQTLERQAYWLALSKLYGKRSYEEHLAELTEKVAFLDDLTAEDLMAYKTVDFPGKGLN